MKTISFFSLFILFGIVLKAQITINSNDLVFVGDTIIQGYDNNISSYVVGGTGEQTWDFSGMTADSEDTLVFVSLSETPFETAFPDAEMAVKILPDTLYMYIDKEPSYLHILGMSANLYNDVHDYPFQNIMPFPVTYGDEFYSDYMSVAKFFNGTDSIMYRQFETDTINVDAYGELTLPSGTFKTLRFYHNVYRADSVFMKVGTDWVLQNRQEYPDDYYEWWTNDPNVKMKIAELRTDEAGNVTDGNFMKNAFIHSTFVKQINNDFLNLIVSNTGNGTILIKNIPKEFNFVRVYDLSGKEISGKSLFPGKEMYLRNLSPGIYVVTFFSPQGKIGKKIIVN